MPFLILDHELGERLRAERKQSRGEIHAERGVGVGIADALGVEVEIEEDLAAGFTDGAYHVRPRGGEQLVSHLVKSAGIAELAHQPHGVVRRREV